MRDIIYNGVGVGESMEEKRAASRVIMNLI